MSEFTGMVDVTSHQPLLALYKSIWVCEFVLQKGRGRTKEKFPKQLKSHLRLTSHEVLMVPIVIWIGVASDYTMFKLIYFDSTKIF